MTARGKFMALTAVLIAIPIVGKAAPGVAVLMAIGSLVVLYIVWMEIDGR
jgi:hypothetical protein